jgi:hypothetical protein
MLYPFELRALANYRAILPAVGAIPSPASQGYERPGTWEDKQDGQMVGAIGFEPMTSTV